MDSRKPDKYKQQSPYKVRSQEHGRINAFYTNITLEEGDHNQIKLVPGVPYLWVYNDKKEIIIGVENPALYPQAFADVSNPIRKATFDLIKPALSSARKLGHPTLAAEFNEQGLALTDRGKAYIGGELLYENDKWILNNVSGRFGMLKNKPKDVQRLMHEVAEKLSASLGLEVAINVTLPHAKYLKAYNKIWKKGGSDVESAMLLLQDYTKSGGVALTFTGHWGRNHTGLVQEAFKYFAEFPPKDIDDLLTYFSINLERVEISENSSLMRRLSFIAAQTKHVFKIGAMKEVEPLLPQDDDKDKGDVSPRGAGGKK